MKLLECFSIILDLGPIYLVFSRCICRIIGGLLQYRGHLPWMLLIARTKTTTITVEDNVDSVKYIFCILHKSNSIFNVYMNTIYIQHTHGHRWTVEGSSTRVFAITRLPSLLPPLHCLSLRSCCRHVTFPSLKKRSSVMTWFLSEFKKGDTVKFSTWSFLWAVYTAFGLSVDPLTRAFKCKHRWWMAMLIKWAELAVFIRFIKVFVLYKTLKCRRDRGFVCGRG